MQVVLTHDNHNAIKSRHQQDVIPPHAFESLDVPMLGPLVNLIPLFQIYACCFLDACLPSQWDQNYLNLDDGNYI